MCEEHRRNSIVSLAQESYSKVDPGHTRLQLGHAAGPAAAVLTVGRGSLSNSS
jgi:hypothetical protein